MKILSRSTTEFLIIDDDPAVSKFLVTYLRHKGHSCESLGDGFGTAEWLGQNECDVIIVDLNMPKIDGIAVIGAIREVNTRVPIIVFTGFGYDEERMHAAL